MSTDDIISGPMDSGLLDQSESAYLLKCLRGSGESLQVPKSLESRMADLQRPRFPLKTHRSSLIRDAASKLLGGNWSTKNKPDLRPKPHSQMTVATAASERKKSKKKKKKEQELKLSPKASSNSSSTTTCVVDCVFRALACIFD